MHWTLIAACGVGGGLSIPTAANAHHSGAMFDETRCISLSGSVRTFQLQYPHTWIWLLVPDKEGAADVWGFESADPATLRRDGWTRDTLTPGDKISVVYSPLKDGRHGGSLHQVTAANGHVFEVGFQPCPAKPK